MTGTIKAGKTKIYKSFKTMKKARLRIVDKAKTTDIVETKNHLTFNISLFSRRSYGITPVVDSTLFSDLWVGAVRELSSLSSSNPSSSGDIASVSRSFRRE